ncbi:hypothetical protein [Photobacterium aquimaris]|uniref:Uncharacterized protein n=1 Tax=Photobacterium aquimaris TaxID=512643 RepID=A0A2T3HT12_9GAMM|nr:hypothetical protein [Photobacterium aquimaris]OBU24691.1 hypothetical protein AYY21_11380 [Photobacterium aquimaris]PQJ38506.1 hypothetical protein BTN98_13935 [Photobacterium aquimaris]PST97845.1 hypothetical protein C0W81_18870 [Photobacterium aquimaris]
MKNNTFSLLAIAVSAAFSSAACADINNIVISDSIEDPTHNKAIAISATKSVSITPCRDAEGISHKRIGEIQGSSYRSPLIADGKYISDAEYLVTGVVSAVTTGLEKGFYLFDDDGITTTSNGIFVETDKPLDANIIGQKSVCVVLSKKITA